jgi:hypothetical protein
MRRIPNGSYTAADILRLARELDVPGSLVRRGRVTETRAYPVALGNGETLQTKVNAPAAAHYTGCVR